MTWESFRRELWKSFWWYVVIFDALWLNNIFATATLWWLHRAMDYWYWSGR